MLGVAYAIPKRPILNVVDGGLSNDEGQFQCDGQTHRDLFSKEMVLIHSVCIQRAAICGFQKGFT